MGRQDLFELHQAALPPRSSKSQSRLASFRSRTGGALRQRPQGRMPNYWPTFRLCRFRLTRRGARTTRSLLCLASRAGILAARVTHRRSRCQSTTYSWRRRENPRPFSKVIAQVLKTTQGRKQRDRSRRRPRGRRGSTSSAKRSRPVAVFGDVDRRAHGLGSRAFVARVDILTRVSLTPGLPMMRQCRRGGTVEALR